jgi:hypothetical protein
MNDINPAEGGKAVTGAGEVLTTRNDASALLLGMYVYEHVLVCLDYIY